MFNRPTSMAAAFLNAACAIPQSKVDHRRGTGNWIARRTLLNAERTGFAVVTEHDKRPHHAKAVVNKSTTEALRESGMDICDELQCSPRLLDEAEGCGSSCD